MKSGSLPRRPALWRSLMIPNFLVQTSHTAWFHPHMMLLLVQFCSWTTPSVRAAWHAAAVPLLSKVRQGFARFSNNNCIGDDTKAAAHRIPKCIRKTKNKFCGTRISVPLPKFVGGKLFPHAKFHWNSAIGCWVMAKNRFSIWRIFAILNFRGPTMGSWKAHVGLPIGRQDTMGLIVKSS